MEENKCTNCGDKIVWITEFDGSRWAHTNGSIKWAECRISPLVATPAATNSSVPDAAPAQSEPKLKPCGWCGNPPFVSQTPDAICCNNNACPVSDHGWMSFDSWNRRAPSLQEAAPSSAMECLRYAKQELETQANWWIGEATDVNMLCVGPDEVRAYKARAAQARSMAEDIDKVLNGASYGTAAPSSAEIARKIALRISAKIDIYDKADWDTEMISQAERIITAEFAKEKA